MTNIVNLQKCTWIPMMTTHYDTPKNVSFELQQSMKTSYEAMCEQIISV